MKKIKLLIAETNYLLREQLTRELMTDFRVELVGTTDNGPDTYEIIQKEKPNIVILDLLLPIYDGFTLIKKLKSTNLRNQIKLIMTIPRANDFLISESYRQGTDYVLVKPYDIQIMADKIRTLYDVALKFTDTTEEHIDKMISKKLSHIGIPANLAGYRYMITAIKQVINNENALEGVTKILYPDVAKVHNSTPQRVEKAIRHAIEVAWNRDDNDRARVEFKYYLKTGKPRPTNSEFLAVMSRQIKV